jgi:hypothetical protein
MAFKGRIQKLEASLEAKKKFLLWLHDAKAVGGFISYWEREIRGSLVPLEWFADEEAYFLWHLVNDVNFAILKNGQANRELRTFAHCALEGVIRQIARPDPAGFLVPERPIPELAERLGRYLCDKFKVLLAESLSLSAAIDEISETYLGGEDLLFVDVRAVLDTETYNLRKTAEVFGPLATWLDMEPITAEGFTTGHPMVDAKATELVDYSHAHALARGGTIGEFLSALRQVSQDLVTP